MLSFVISNKNEKFLKYFVFSGMLFLITLYQFFRIQARLLLSNLRNLQKY